MASKKQKSLAPRFPSRRRKPADASTNGLSLLEAAKSAPRSVGARRGSTLKPEQIDERVELALAYLNGSVAASQVAAACNVENAGQFAQQALWAGLRSGRWTIQRAK
jgi:hypothetical protein